MTPIIARHVAKARHVRWNEIMGKRRHRHISHARQEAMWIARQMTEQSYPEIGHYFRRHHTTVMHAEEAVNARMAEDVAYRRDLEKMMEELNA